MVKKHMDPVSEAAMEMVEMEKRREDIAAHGQADREKQIADCYKAIGRIQAVNMMSKIANVSEMIWIKEIKDSKLYKDLPGLETWEKFCNSIGYTSTHIDNQLSNLNTFGEAFLQTVLDLRVSHRDLRKLRQLTNDGTVTIDEAEIIIGGETIPFTPEHRDDLQAALERVIETNAKIITDKEATIKAKDKVLQHKSEMIEKQAKELSKLEDNAARNGLMPAEEAFFKRIDHARTSFDGFMIGLDPINNPLPSDATPRMRAVYIESLAYFRRVFEAAHELAVEYYDTSSLEDGWIPPSGDEN